MVGRVAKFWNRLPWEFESLEPEKQAQLHAIYTVEMECQQYYDSEQARHMDQETDAMKRK